MQELYSKLKKYNLDDAIRIEETDRQFIALKKVSNLIQSFPFDKRKEKTNLYIFLVIANSLVCYQLSWKGEDYWEEFGEYFSNPPLTPPSKKVLQNKDLINDLIVFLKQSKYNKRFINIKTKRLEKLRTFLEHFNWKWEYYYNNMIELRDKLSELMNQKKDAKTITFTIKIYSYFVRNFYDFVEYPKEILIPIDSRLTNLFEKYKWNYTDIKKFYKDLSNKLNIPMLHLDWIVWTLYDDLIK